MSQSQYVYASDPGLLIGFHGCDQSVCEAVISGKTSLRPSNKDWDWLADGIYFWQNNYARAMHYAMDPPKGVKITTPAVLGAVFSLGHCLDLTDQEWLDLVSISFETVKNSYAAKGEQLPANKDPKASPNSKDKVLRRLDCAVIKSVHEENAKAGLPHFDSVRGLFPEGGELYDGAGFQKQTHIQIAIRNPNCIKGYFLPRKQTVWPR